MSIIGTILSNWALCIEILFFSKVSQSSPRCDGAWMKWGEKMVWKERKCDAVKRQFNKFFDQGKLQRALSVNGRNEPDLWGQKRWAEGEWEAPGSDWPLARKLELARREGEGGEREAHSLHFSFFVSVHTTSEWDTCWSASGGRSTEGKLNNFCMPHKFIEPSQSVPNSNLLWNG